MLKNLRLRNEQRQPKPFEILPSIVRLSFGICHRSAFCLFLWLFSQFWVLNFICVCVANLFSWAHHSGDFFFIYTTALPIHLVFCIHCVTCLSSDMLTLLISCVFNFLMWVCFRVRCCARALKDSLSNSLFRMTCAFFFQHIGITSHSVSLQVPFLSSSSCSSSALFL